MYISHYRRTFEIILSAEEKKKLYASKCNFKRLMMSYMWTQATEPFASVDYYTFLIIKFFKMMFSDKIISKK